MFTWIIIKTFIVNKLKDYILGKISMGILASIQGRLATFVGDCMVSYSQIGIWPYPLVALGEYRSLVTGNDYRCISALMLPGDMILTTQKRAVGSNNAIPGSFKHLMVYTGAVEGTQKEGSGSISKPRSLGIDHKFQFNYSPTVFQKTITHAESDGVGTYDFLDIFSHYDYICVVRPWTTPEEQKAIVSNALSQVGKEYNFVFLDSSKDPTLYCTQLGWHCLNNAKIPAPQTIKKMTRFWKPWEKNEILIADHYVGKYPVVCTSVSCNDPEFARKSAIGDTMREKLLAAPDASRAIINVKHGTGFVVEASRKVS